jgi:hypothetical protein
VGTEGKKEGKMRRVTGKGKIPHQSAAVDTEAPRPALSILLHQENSPPFNLYNQLFFKSTVMFKGPKVHNAFTYHSVPENTTTGNCVLIFDVIL